MKLSKTFVILGMVWLTACSTLDVAVEPAPTNTQTALSPLQTVSPEVTTPATIIPTTSATMLPAPLYFISQGQIWRWEPDAQTLRQITHETSWIVGMDVSPVDGALAYVGANQLILADAEGNGRRVLIQGTPPARTPDVAYRLTAYMSSPAWSPDGQRLAYGLNGVNMITLSNGQVTHLLDNPAPPTGGYDIVTNFQPHGWTLDGTGLFVGGETACQLLSVTGEPFAKDVFWGGGGCAVAWSNDDRSVFAANYGSAYSTFGIWQIDAATGAVTTLLGGDYMSATNAAAAAFPKQAPDGRLFFFYQSDVEGSQPMFVAAPLNNLAQMTSLRPINMKWNAVFLSEALWASDASLVVLSEYEGPLQILRTDGSPMITLPVSKASDLRWGIK